MTSHVDRFGRLEVSGEDARRFGAMWDERHGSPRNDMEIILREQWVSRAVLREIRAREVNTIGTGR